MGNKNEPFIWDLETAKKEHKHSPALASALANILPKDVPVIDYGCGKGTYIHHLYNQGFQCLGIEGTTGIKEIADFANIEQHDLSKPIDQSHWPRSTSICLEVAEHIAPENEAVFLKNITQNCSDWLILSWAIPGQGGCGHHNEKPAEYVIPTVEDLGFRFQYTESKVLRAVAGAELWWFQKSLYVFRKELS